MKHFTLATGETLGTTMAGGKAKGRQLMQTKTEEQLMWSLHQDTLCLEDEHLEWKLSDLMDFFLKECKRLTKEEFLAKGFKESRWEEGCSMQMGTDESGGLFWMR